MKKLMIAAAIVCAAVASQASTVKWQYNAKMTDGSGSSSKYCTGDANTYLVLASDLARADAIADLVKAGSVAAYESAPMNEEEMKAVEVKAGDSFYVMNVSGDELSLFIPAADID